MATTKDKGERQEGHYNEETDHECSNDAGDQAATPPSSSSQRVGVPVALARVDRSGSDEGDEQVEEDDWTSQLTRPADTIIIISWDHGLGCGGCGFFFCGMVRRGAGHGISSFGGGVMWDG